MLTHCANGDRFERVWRAQVCGFSKRSQRLYGFYAPETLALVYGAFVLRGRACGLAELVYGAISAGGDTDSTESMVAAMAVLASGGTIEMPADDCELVAQIDELRCLADDFARAATRIISAGAFFEAMARLSTGGVRVLFSDVEVPQR